MVKDVCVGFAAVGGQGTDDGGRKVLSVVWRRSSGIRIGEADVKVSAERVLCGACPCARSGSLSQAPQSKRRRASGGCLGTERRGRTWHAAKSRGEGRAPVDPRISEWGNPAHEGHRRPNR